MVFGLMNSLMNLIFFFPFSYLKSIEHEGLVVGAQLLVWQAAWTSPAHPHLACRHHLQLKVPLPGIHTVRLFSTEDPEALRGYVVDVGSSCWRRGTRKQVTSQRGVALVRPVILHLHTTTVTVSNQEVEFNVPLRL